MLTVDFYPITLGCHAQRIYEPDEDGIVGPESTIGKNPEGFGRRVAYCRKGSVYGCRT